MTMSGRSKRRRFLVGLAITLVTGTLFCLAFSLDLFSSWQLRSSDLFFRAADMRQGAGMEGRIVIVGIDDKSLEKLGHFSQWPRSHYARLVDVLAAAKARVVAFDLLFAEPAPGDVELAASIKRAGNVILPWIYTPGGQDSIATFGAPTGQALRPLKVFKENVVDSGHANIIPDADGVTRRLPLFIHNGNNLEPALGLVIAARYLRSYFAIDSPVENNTVYLTGRTIPLVDGSKMLINYIDGPKGAGGTLNFPVTSFADVLTGNVDPAVFNDKIVLIGAMASGLGDTFWTPMGRMVRGVEVHASASSTILGGNFLRPAAYATNIFLIMALTILGGLAVLRLPTRWSVLLNLVFVSGYFLVAFTLFDRGLVVNMFYPPLAIVGVFLGNTTYNVTTERSEKRALTQTFGRFVSPPVAGKILNALEEGELKLGGKEHDVTVLFADVRGFTGISEEMPPERLVQVLNIYLSVLIDAILNNRGIINKFGGDSVMAVWNVPVECPTHTLLAVKASIQAQRSIKNLRETKKNLPEMVFGMGINTGIAVAGNLGSKDRLEYSVIGDTVNIAAKLAGAAPGGKIWLGAAAFQQVKDYVATKTLDRLVVRGKKEPVEAYEVTGIYS